MRLLYRLSQLRGQDAAGLAVMDNNHVEVLRRVIKPMDFIRIPLFELTLRRAYNNCARKNNGREACFAVGHCRLVTNGSFAVHENNQPVIADPLVAVHNGIILNAHALGAKLSENPLSENFQISAESALSISDSKLLLSAIASAYSIRGELKKAVSEVFYMIDGSASIAALDGSAAQLVLATNTGSLYILEQSDRERLVFASERAILNRFLQMQSQFIDGCKEKIVQVSPGRGYLVTAVGTESFSFKEKNNSCSYDSERPARAISNMKILDHKASADKIRRCTKCILPETYPYIVFDNDGVCNYCHSYERQKCKGEPALLQLLDKFRSSNGEPDCLVGLSGGRDSCYGLHVLKQVYGMNPIAYTYDWGLTTDKSRRNQSRICGQLGVEHILRAPDITKKRRFVRKNIHAWLRSPKLGMVPLFMAGDKDFYHYGRQLRKELGLGLTVFCSGHLQEQRDFFVGFCGVPERVTVTARTYHYRPKVKFKLARYYITQYLMNTAYINESFFDSIRSYFTTFIQKDDFLYLYEYLPWDEKQIETVLKENYDWEKDESYGVNQWRMGDGQTAFTNYIFYTVAGFSEFDTFRATQVREGQLTRAEALELSKQDNCPRWETLQYFSHLVGINLEEVLAAINTIPKLYYAEKGF